METEVGTEVPVPSVPAFICEMRSRRLCYIEQISAVLHAFD